MFVISIQHNMYHRYIHRFETFIDVFDTRYFFIVDFIQLFKSFFLKLLVSIPKTSK